MYKHMDVGDMLDVVIVAVMGMVPFFALIMAVNAARI